MPRYQGSGPSDYNVISLRLDSGDRLIFQRRDTNVHVYLQGPGDQTDTLVTLSVKRLCTLSYALTKMCLGTEHEEGERFSLLEVD